MWQAIQYVGSPLALVAFVAAVVATIYRARVRADLEKLRSLPDTERSEFLQQSLETYHIADDNLTRQQKYELMMLVLTQRAHRLKILAQTAIALTTIIAITVVIVLLTRSTSAAISTREDPTWKRNYQYFAAREWPDKPNSGKTDAPDTWIKVVWRPSLVNALNSLVLDDEPSLQAKRDILLSSVKNAPIMNEQNPKSIQIDQRLDDTFHEFKRLLRAAAAKRNVDVERLEHEQYVEPQ